MESVKRMSILGIVALLLFTSGMAFAQSPCSILIAGQSLGVGLYEQRSGILEVINTDDFKMKNNCSSISFANGASGSAAECAIAQQPELTYKMNCWINHNPDYRGGRRYGNAFLMARKQIDYVMNNPDATERRRIIALIWSQGETDSFYMEKPLSELITEPDNLCTIPNVYCKAAYKHNVAEIFAALRSIIANYSSVNFGLAINGENIPIFISAIGRRAFLSNIPASSIIPLDNGIQAIRNAQYEIANEGVNVYIGALGYDQPLRAIEPGKNSQAHPTPDGYLETAKRLGFAILSHFNQAPVYIGPKVVEAVWDGMDIVVTVTHSTKTMMPGVPNCTAPRYCGFRVIDGAAASLAIEVSMDGRPIIVNGLKHTRYRITLPDQPKTAGIDLAFAFGSMHEINVLRSIAGVDSNDAKYILKQKCLSTVSLAECNRPENRRLPIQPAFFHL